jgi:uncharacterized repeat protein (TIGR04076 family)
MEEKREPEAPEFDKDFLRSVAKRIKEGSRYYQEATINRVSGQCPYGHREGETYKITNVNAGGLCGALYNSIRDSVLTTHYGACVPWEKSAGAFKGVCPEMKVEVDVRRMEKEDLKLLRSEYEARDMTGKGFPALDKYRMFVEILHIGRACTWGHRPGQRFELDPFNVGGVCAMLYCQAYHTMNILFSEKNLPWNAEEHIAHLVCPDTYNETAFRLVREKR